MQSMKKTAVLIAALILLVGGWRIYEAILSSGAGAADERPAVTVALVPVERKAIEDIGNFTGSLLPRSQFIAASKIGGRLENVLVDIGDEVEYNQLIAVLDDDEYALQADRARAELEVSKASLEEARSSRAVSRRELERVRTLFDKDIAAEVDHDIASDRFVAQKARYEVALAQVDQREAQLQEAEVRLSYTRVRATWEASEQGGGKRVIGQRFRYEGSMLTPNTPIVSILDISTLLAVIHVIERDYSKVRTGMQATITTDAYPDKVFTGKVVRIAPRLEESSRQARTEIEVPNPDNLLKPGMFVRVVMTFGVHENATVVPAAALARRDGDQGLFLADTQQMTVEFVPVKVGITTGAMTEIIEPSISGQVVQLGHHLLEDGAPIKLGEDGE
ncbi:MAG: efflux RND transporter periplasmic adaptor subunit [Candidatus Glassbacteria bacterium]|nr:efflux RND transporter periplasmic adaptor subunit [Candidatus Glassbacteria bacterium]